MIKILISVVFAGCHWNNIAFDSDKIPVQSRQIMDTNSQIDNTKEGFQDDSLNCNLKDCNRKHIKVPHFKLFI